MKKVKSIIILSSCLLVLVLFVTGISVFAFPFEIAGSPTKKSRTISENEIALKQKANGKVEINETYSISRDSQLDDKLATFNEQEAEADANDKMAYAILGEYKGSEYNRLSIITDYNTDVTYMTIMLELLRTNNLTSNESFILKQYLTRRVSWLEDLDLKASIKTIIG